MRVYADTADYFMESLYENQASGVTAILAEEGNLTQALGLALEAEQWDSAQLLVQPLAQVYRMQKRYPELQRLRGQLLESVGVTAAEAKERGSIELWVYLQGTAASEATELLHLNQAEALNQELLEYLAAQPEGEQDPRTAAVYHQFGIISLNRRQWDEAAGWLQKSWPSLKTGKTFIRWLTIITPSGRSGRVSGFIPRPKSGTRKPWTITNASRMRKKWSRITGRWG